jgi:hypothetical protein
LGWGSSSRGIGGLRRGEREHKLPFVALDPDMLTILNRALENPDGTIIAEHSVTLTLIHWRDGSCSLEVAGFELKKFPDANAAQKTYADILAYERIAHPPEGRARDE